MSCHCGQPNSSNPFLCDACADKAWAPVQIVSSKPKQVKETKTK